MPTQEAAITAAMVAVVDRVKSLVICVDIVEAEAELDGLAAALVALGAVVVVTHSVWLVLAIQTVAAVAVLLGMVIQWAVVRVLLLSNTNSNKEKHNGTLCKDCRWSCY